MVIHIQNLGKIFRVGFKKIPALQNANLIVSASGIVGILGPKDSGKTTLLRILAGLTGWDTGSVQVLGSEDPRDVRRHTGFLPENPSFLANFSPERFLRFCLKLYPGEEITAWETSEQALASLGLTGVRKQRINSLSAGERRLFGVIQAMAHRPDLLLLDDPLRGLDADHRRRLIDLLVAYQRQGKTVVFTTRCLQDIEEISTEVVVLNKGEVRFHEKMNLLQTQCAYTIEAEAGNKRFSFRPGNQKKLWDTLDEARIKDMRIIAMRSSISHILENYYEKQD